MSLLFEEIGSSTCIDHWFANPLWASESPGGLLKISMPESTLLEFDHTIWEWDPNIVIF